MGVLIVEQNAFEAPGGADQAHVPALGQVAPEGRAADLPADPAMRHPCLGGGPAVPAARPEPPTAEGAIMTEAHPAPAPKAAPPLAVNLTGMAYETDAGVGRRANIGLLVLETDLTIEDEFRHVLPEGVALYGARLRSPAEITPEKLRLMEAEIPGAAGLLPAIDFDAVGFGCTSGALVIGEPVVAERVREARPGVAVTDPVSAAIAATRALGARRVAVLTPYLPEINAALRAQFQQRGMEIPVMGSFNQPDDYVVARITPAAIRDAMIELGRAPEVDAVFVSCTSLRVARIVREVEAAIGKPVTSSNHALAWRLLRLSGVADSLPEHGRLFETA